jgi:copper resistance protein C
MVRSRSPFVALLLTALLLAPVGMASAHDELTGTDPKDGATVEEPDELVLTFSGAIGDLGAQIAVTGPDGESVVDGGPDVDGTRVEQDLVEDLAAGDYEVIWRVTSEDGHPISGEFAFTVEAVADDSGDDATDDNSDDAAAAATTEETTEPAQQTSAATDEAPEDADVTAEPAQAQGEGGLPTWAWVVLALAAAALGGLLARTWVRGRE